jgi:hypothetical protein
MKVILSRMYGKDETKGLLMVIDSTVVEYFFKTLEPPNNGNIPFMSCINEGTYWMIKYHSPTKNEWVFLILDVPGREGVEMHVGNFAVGKKTDTDGCILPGMSFVDLNGDGTLDVADSKKAMDKLMSILPNKIKLIIC